MTSKNQLKHGLKTKLYLKFLLITQHEVPFINTSEAKKWSKEVKQRSVKRPKREQQMYKCYHTSLNQRWATKEVFKEDVSAISLSFLTLDLPSFSRSVFFFTPPQLPRARNRLLKRLKVIIFQQNLANCCLLFS